MNELRAATSQKNRETSGKLATLIWLASGVYLFATTPQAHFISWQAAIFFFVGMFVAAFVLGGASFLVTTYIAKLAEGQIQRQPMIASTLALCGLIIFVADFVIGFLVARFVFHRLVG